jgi:MSHA pilin protein MshD
MRHPLPPSARPRRTRAPRGFTLIDVLIMVTLLGVVAGAMTTLFTRLAAQSSDTLRGRQALAVAQSLLNEVRLMPFTYCDADDTQAGSAAGAFLGAGGCASTVDAQGPEPGEGRTVTGGTLKSARFDGVGDYHNFAQPGPDLRDIRGNLLTGASGPLRGCSTRVTTTPQAMPLVAALDGYGRPQALRITVRVNCPNLAEVVLESIRMRHAPQTT